MNENILSNDKIEDEVNTHSYISYHSLDVPLNYNHIDNVSSKVTCYSSVKQYNIQDNMSSTINHHEKEKQILYGLPISRFKSEDLCSDCKKISKFKSEDLCSDCKKIVTETTNKHDSFHSYNKVFKNQYRHSQDDFHKKSSEKSTNIRQKIRNMMKHHSDAMLVKRVEHKEQLILEPSKSNKNLETIKRNKMNTRYYIAPLNKGDELIYKNDQYIDNDTNSAEHTKPEIKYNFSDSSIASKCYAKKEVSNILKTLKTKPEGNKVSTIKDNAHRGTKTKVTCPKITVSQIRSYVENKMFDPSERQLHEIIKVETIPSKNSDQKIGRNYTINIPKGDSRNVNIVKIKEKRKLQINKVVEANDSSLRRSISLQSKEENCDIPDNRSKKPLNVIKRVENTPMETRVFEVKTMQTPIITPLVDENKRNKILFIEHETNYNPKHKIKGIEPLNLKKTKLLGIKQECDDLSEEIFMYDTESDGKHFKEKVNRVGVVSPSLKEKVNSIFEELKEISFRQKTPELIEASKTHTYSTGTNTEYNQYCPSNKMSDRDLHIVKSAAVQVESSLLLGKHSSKDNLNDILALTSSTKSLKDVSKEALSKTSKETLRTKEALREKKDYLRKSIQNQELSDSQKEKPLSDTTIKKVGSISKTLYAPVDHSQLSEDKAEQNLLKSSNVEEITKEIETSLARDTMKTSLKSTESKRLMQIPEDKNLHSLKDNNLNFDNKKRTDLEIDLKKQNDNVKTHDEVKQNLKYQEHEKSVKEKIVDTEVLNQDLYGQQGDTMNNEYQQDKYGPEQHMDKFDQEKQEDKYVHEQQQDKYDKEQELGKEHVDKYNHKEHEYRHETPISKQSSSKLQLNSKHQNFTDNLKSVTSHRYSYTSSRTPKFESNLLLKNQELKSVISEEINKFEENEDIRSYNIPSHQDVELKFKSDSKFHHKKEAIRKRMNWTDNTVYLEKNMCPQLISALVDTAIRRPADPISHLANWIYKDYHNKEKEEERQNFQEHLNLARTMNTLYENMNPNTNVVVSKTVLNLASEN